MSTKYVQIIVMAIVVFALILIPKGIFAAQTAGDLLLGGATSTAGKAGVDINGPEVQNLVGSIVSGALTLVGVLFFLLMLYGGITWMLARGNDEYSKRALNTIVAAIVGLIVVGASYAITQFVINSVNTQTQNPNTPGCCVLIDGGTGQFVVDVGTSFSCQGDPVNNVIAEFYPVPDQNLLSGGYCEVNCASGECTY